MLLETFFKNELEKNYSLVSMAKASIYTIEDILDILGLLKKNKKLRQSIQEIQNIFSDIQRCIETFKSC